MKLSGNYLLMLQRGLVPRSARGECYFHCLEDGGGKILQNVGKKLLIYTVSFP